jgi:hypothetical protein
MTEIVLHLGAHKTATTWLQKRLEAGLPALRAIGVDYEPLGPFRRAVADPLDEVIHQGETPERLAALRGALEGYLSRGAARFIASDENILGQCNPIVNSGRLYGTAKRRAQTVASLLPAPPAMTLLTIRSYAPFLASVYCESLWHAKFNSFEEFRARLVTDDGLWVRVVQGLVDVFGAERVRIVRYETLQASLPAMLHALCGQEVDPAQLPESTDRNERLSARAVEELGRFAEETNRLTARRRLREFANRFPRSAEFPAFDPWTEEERARLDALYAQHLATIAERWPGVLI